MRHPHTRLERLRKQAGGHAINGILTGLSRAGRLHPRARPERHGVEVIRDLPYREGGSRAHLLDVYRPVGLVGTAPAVLYVHGGGFRILSKDTHWMMALHYAAHGFVVFTINYRLAPQHPYPAALEDASAAYVWVVENAARFGGDVSRLVVSGESAGANLACALTIEACWPRPEPWASAVWEAGVVPKVLVPKCGMLEVSNPERFLERRALSTFLSDRIVEVSRGYLGAGRADAPGGLDLADPLRFLERASPPPRPLPPSFVTVGTRDPILDDSRRLRAALARLDTRSELRVYPGEIHAFQAFVHRPNARSAWRETLAFVDEAVSAPSGTSA